MNTSHSSNFIDFLLKKSEERIVKTISYEVSIANLVSIALEEYFNSLMQGGYYNFEIHLTLKFISRIYDVEFKKVNSDFYKLFDLRKKDLHLSENWELAVKGKYKF